MHYTQAVRFGIHLLRHGFKEIDCCPDKVQEFARLPHSENRNSIFAVERSVLAFLMGNIYKTELGVLSAQSLPIDLCQGAHRSQQALRGLHAKHAWNVAFRWQVNTGLYNMFVKSCTKKVSQSEFHHTWKKCQINVAVAAKAVTCRSRVSSSWSQHLEISSNSNRCEAIQKCGEISLSEEMPRYVNLNSSNKAGPLWQQQQKQGNLIVKPIGQRCGYKSQNLTSKTTCLIKAQLHLINLKNTSGTRGTP